jgi:hypothetical protein
VEPDPPRNFWWVYSYGGTQDSTLDPTIDRVDSATYTPQHSRDGLLVRCRSVRERAGRHAPRTRSNAPVQGREREPDGRQQHDHGDGDGDGVTLQPGDGLDATVHLRGAATPRTRDEPTAPGPFPPRRSGRPGFGQPIPSMDFAVVQLCSIAVCAADRVTWWAQTVFLTAFSFYQLIASRY